MFMRDVVENVLTELKLSGMDGVEYSLTNLVCAIYRMHKYLLGITELPHQNTLRTKTRLFYILIITLKNYY
jgi:hypothetical protein